LGGKVGNWGGYWGSAPEQAKEMWGEKRKPVTVLPFWGTQRKAEQKETLVKTPPKDPVKTTRTKKT